MAFIVDPRARRELIKSLQRFFREYRRSKTGMFGLILLVIFVVVSVAYPVIGDPVIVENWMRNPEYFSGIYPERAPPCWVSRITGVTYTSRQIIPGENVAVNMTWGNVTVIDIYTGNETVVPELNITLEFTFKIDGDVPTKELTLIFKNITYSVKHLIPSLSRYAGIAKQMYDIYYQQFQNEDLALQFTKALCKGVPWGEINTLQDIVLCLYQKSLAKGVASFYFNTVKEAMGENATNTEAINYTAKLLCPDKQFNFGNVEDREALGDALEAIGICLLEKGLAEYMVGWEKYVETITAEVGELNKTTDIITYLQGEGLIRLDPFNVTMLYLYRPDGSVLPIITPEEPYSVETVLGTNPFEYTREDFKVRMITGVFSRKVPVKVGEAIEQVPLISLATLRLYNMTVDETKADLNLLPFAQNITAVIEGRRDVPVLKGEYRLVMGFRGVNVTKINMEIDRVVVTGSCYGLLGTDDKGRDLWQGVLYGVRWALVIGVLTSLLSVLLGAIYGVLSGYYGGLKDEVMLRIAQIIYSLPVLPLLILLSYVIKPSIWTLILILVAFGWPGVAFVTRSMALQIKESVYVEAARALGASDRRITLLYVFPQILPYLFASIALSVPGAILAEAGLSFLGLGDPYTLTWGKILHDAQNASAVLNGLWWWVVPPGLAIALVGMTFIFIGNAIDAILNPKLKR